MKIVLWLAVTAAVCGLASGVVYDVGGADNTAHALAAIAVTCGIAAGSLFPFAVGEDL